MLSHTEPSDLVCLHLNFNGVKITWCQFVLPNQIALLSIRGFSSLRQLRYFFVGYCFKIVCNNFGFYSTGKLFFCHPFWHQWNSVWIFIYSHDGQNIDLFIMNKKKILWKINVNCFLLTYSIFLYKIMAWASFFQLAFLSFWLGFFRGKIAKDVRSMSF